MTYAAEVLADSPAWYLRLGEASGSTAVDSSGNSRPGTVAGTMTMGVAGALAGDSDTAYTFDGSTAKITVPDTAGDDSTGRTYEAWIKTTANTRTIMCRDISGSSKAFRLDVASNKVRYLHFDSAGSAQYLSGATSVNDGAWHHVVVTVTNATSNATATIYVDGASDGSITFASSDTVDTGADFTIGVARTSQWWSGSMDEVAYYRTALSAARVAAHHAAGTTAAVDYIKDLADPVGITDLPAEQSLDLSLALPDDLGITDSVSTGVTSDLVVTLADDVGVSDSAGHSAELVLAATVTDQVGVVDAASASARVPTPAFYYDPAGSLSVAVDADGPYVLEDA